MKNGNRTKKGSVMKKHAIQIIEIVTAAVCGCFFITAAQAEQATIRPVSQFVEAQGTYCLFSGTYTGSCYLTVNLGENFMSWSSPCSNLHASIDYAGLADRRLQENGYNGGHGLGTSFEGTIVDRTLSDGRAEVKVLLKTKNALTWIIEDTYPDSGCAGGTLLLGHRTAEVLGGADPALSDSLLELVFINDAPGAPMPDLVDLVVNRATDIVSIAFVASGDGQLRSASGVPDGTPRKTSVAVISTVRGLPSRMASLLILR